MLTLPEDRLVRFCGMAEVVRRNDTARMRVSMVVKGEMKVVVFQEISLDGSLYCIHHV